MAVTTSAPDPALAMPVTPTLAIVRNAPVHIRFGDEGEVEIEDPAKAAEVNPIEVKPTVELWDPEFRALVREEYDLSSSDEEEQQPLAGRKRPRSEVNYSCSKSETWYSDSDEEEHIDTCADEEEDESANTELTQLLQRLAALPAQTGPHTDQTQQLPPQSQPQLQPQPQFQPQPQLQPQFQSQPVQQPMPFSEAH